MVFKRLINILAHASASDSARWWLVIDIFNFLATEPNECDSKFGYIIFDSLRVQIIGLTIFW